MKKYSFIVLISLLSTINSLFSQNIINNECTSFSVKTINDTIEFLVVDSNITHKKPIFLWFQGSQPYPLYVKHNQSYTFLGGGLSNFDLQNIKEDFHIVVISPPTVPLMVDVLHLSKELQYVPDINEPRQPSVEYQHADYLENYVSRANEVLGFLKKEPWIDTTYLVVAAHSQGTRVASRFSLINKPDIVALFSPNPLSRITEMIRTPFFKAKQGTISWEEAEKEVEYFTNINKWIKNEEIVKSNPSLKAWKSFSVNPIEDWFQLRSKLYIAYGTDDASADLCSIIPLYEDEFTHGIPTIVKYNDLEHNFFSRNNTAHWNTVMHDFYSWIKANRKSNLQF